MKTKALGQKATFNRHRTRTGHVLIELLLVIGLIAMMTGIAILSFSSMWGNLRFKRQADQLVNTFQMAYNAASESDRRYAVILDLIEQSYVLREFKSLDLETMHPDEAIIQTNYFSEALTIDYVLYDDLDFLSLDELEDKTVADARFLAGKSGWQYGGIIVLRDDAGMPWTIVVHRFAKPVELLEGEWDLDSLGMLPEYIEDVPF
jgi:type II secretory pathway pseudopilin PulG